MPATMAPAAMQTAIPIAVLPATYPKAEPSITPPNIPQINLSATKWSFLIEMMPERIDRSVTFPAGNCSDATPTIVIFGNRAGRLGFRKK